MNNELKNGATISKPQFFDRDRWFSFSVRTFILLITGAQILLVVFAFVYIAISFRSSFSQSLQEDLDDFVVDSEAVLSRTIDRFVLATEAVARDRALQRLVDDPNVSIEVSQQITRQKVVFRLEEAFFLSESGRLLFKDSADSSFLINPLFKKLIDDALRFKNVQTAIVDSVIYQKPVLFIALPVYGKAKSGVIVYGKVLSEEYFKTLFPSAKRGIYIFSQSGNLAVANIQDQSTLRAIESAFSDVLPEVLQTNEQFVKNVQSEKFNGVVYASTIFNGPFPIGKGGFFIDETELFAAQRNLTIVVVSLTVVLFLFLGVFFFFITRILLNPLRSIENGLMKMAHGEFGTHLNPTGLQELQTLSMGFNSMALQLQTFYRELETKVAERTQELDKKIKEIGESNIEMEKSKEAILNLLEDARILENKLSQEGNRLNAVLASMDEGLFAVDKTLQVMLVNDAAKKMLGRESKEIVGRRLHEIFQVLGKDGAIIKDNEQLTRLTLTKGEIYATRPEDDIYVKNMQGKKFPIFEIASPLRDEAGAVIGAVVVFGDISERKRLDESRISFISISSHQLRTPLTSIRWFSEMLLDGDAGKLSENQKHYIERIYQGTSRMINLVNLLLQIARVEAGRVKIEPVLVDLANTTKGVALALKADIKIRNQKVNIAAKPQNMPMVPMDYDVIWQVIQNLLSNAIRYSQKGGVISVNIVKKENHIEYSVKDNGIGIPENQKEKVFQKFFRTDNALLFAPEGSGLGLSLVKSLVEGWGGKIWFESTLGKGSAFHFTIPPEGMKPKKGEVKLTV